MHAPCRRPVRSVTRRLAALFATLLLAGLPAICGGCSVFQPNTTNLLKEVNPETDAVEGSWYFEKSALASEVAPHARIAFTRKPHGDYELYMTFARVINDGPVLVILPVENRQVLLRLADKTMNGDSTGLDYINGRSAADNATIVRDFQLINNRRYKLKATVRTRESEARIHIDLDDKPLVRWHGPVSALSLPDDWLLTGGATLGVGASDAVIQIYSARLRMIPAETSEVH